MAKCCICGKEVRTTADGVIACGKVYCWDCYKYYWEWEVVLMNRIRCFVKSGMLRLGFKDTKLNLLPQAPCVGCSVDTIIKVNRSRAIKAFTLMASSRPAHGGGDRR